MLHTDHEIDTPRPRVAGMSDNQWQSRCSAWLVGLAPFVAIEDAGQLVAAACTIGSYRQMSPEDAAERLLRNPTVRL